MVQITLHGMEASPAVRACLLTLKALNLPYEYKHVDLMAQEHLSEEYLKKNPQHTVPTLEDDGHFIWDSHAIMAYLVSRYAKEDSLYPKDLLQRALVDQRLHFDSGVVFQSLLSISSDLFYKKQTEIPKYKIDAIHDAYNFLEIFLQDMPYMAGKQLTIADFSIVSTVTSSVAFAEIDADKYPKLTAWIKRLETSLPYYKETNAVGAEKLIKVYKSMNYTFAA